MIRLEITDPSTSHILVPHLPAEISFDMVRENPLFNRRGDYTYDIDISLRDSHNRAIYQHIDRLTASSRPQNRRARLLCDGHVIADGTEVILKKEGDMLKVQILAGNSEMNYLIVDDSLRIREMDFGRIEEPEDWGTQKEAIGDQFYPYVNYALPVLYTGMDASNAAITAHYKNVVNGEGWIPQPFLLYYVEQFIHLIGYTLRHNTLRSHAEWCRLLVVHGHDTLEYAKMLPDWSAAEFLTYVEQFFNCVFVVDPLSKEVDIHYLKDWYEGNQDVEIATEDIADEFVREYDSEDNVFQNNYRNLSYKYSEDAGNYWKYANLDGNVERRCQQLPMSLADAYLLGDPDWKVFTEPEYGFKFIRQVWNLGGSTIDQCLMVDHFAPYVSDEEATDMQLGITPAITFMNSAIGSSISEMLYYPCAIPRLFEQKPDDTDFRTAIRNGLDNEDAASVMEVAFYAAGIKVRRQQAGSRVLVADPSMEFGPTCFTRCRYLNGDLMLLIDSDVPGIEKMTLELNGEQGLVAQHFNTGFVDTTQKHTLYIRNRRQMDVTSLYLIHGRLFLCQQLKYSYRDGRQHPIVEGIFYPYINMHA